MSSTLDCWTSGILGHVGTEQLHFAISCYIEFICAQVQQKSELKASFGMRLEWQALGDFFFCDGGKGNLLEIFCCNNLSSEAALTVLLQKFLGISGDRVGPESQEGVGAPERHLTSVCSQLILWDCWATEAEFPNWFFVCAPCAGCSWGMQLLGCFWLGRN